MQHSFSRRRRGPGGAERGLRVRGTRAVCERAGAPRLRALQCSAQSRKRIKLGFISLVETPPPLPVWWLWKRPALPRTVSCLPAA